MKFNSNNWKYPVKSILLAVWLTVGSAFADAQQIDEFQWEGEKN